MQRVIIRILHILCMFILLIFVVCTAVVEQLIYRWCYILIEKNAEATLEMILSKPKLHLHNLLPAWFYYCDLLQQQVIPSSQLSVNYAVVFMKSYFEHLMADNTLSMHGQTFGTAFHALIWVLCKYDESADESSLISALSFDCDPANDLLPLVSNTSGLDNTTTTSINNNNNNNYDDISLTIPKDMFTPASNPYIDYFFVLRLCQSFQRPKGIVFTLLILGMHRDAVEAALGFNLLSLAKVSLYL